MPLFDEISGEPGLGGGVYNAGTLTIVDSTISNNETDSGGGIYNVGDLTIHRSAIYGNNGALEGGGIANVALGGAFGGTVTINNSTFSGNSGAAGSGDILARQGAVTINNSTFSGSNGNLSAGGSGGIFVVNNSILKSNGINANCTGSDAHSGSNNLMDDATCDAVGIIGPVTNFDTTLADNGGRTWTHALLAGSNAINAGINGCQDDAGDAAGN